MFVKMISSLYLLSIIGVIIIGIGVRIDDKRLERAQKIANEQIDFLLYCDGHIIDNGEEAYRLSKVCYDELMVYLRHHLTKKELNIFIMYNPHSVIKANIYNQLITSKRCIVELSPINIPNNDILG